MSVDSIKKIYKKQSKAPKDKTLLSPTRKHRSNQHPVTPRNTAARLFFSFIAVIVVLVIWGLSLKINWQRITNGPRTVHNTQDLESLKIQFTELLNQASTVSEQISQSTFPTTTKDIPLYNTTTATITKEFLEAILLESGIPEE